MSHIQPPYEALPRQYQDWRRTRRQVIRGLASGLAGIALTACAAPAAPPAQAPAATPAKAAPTTASAAAPPAAKPAGAASPAAEAKPAPKPQPAATQAPAKREIVKLTIAQSAPSLTNAPLHLATGKKLWEAESLEVDVQVLQGGPLTTTAVANGEAQLMASGSDSPFVAIEKGLDFYTVAGIATGLTFEFGANRDFLQRKGVSRQSPLQDRLVALKGSKIGIASPAGSPAVYGPYTLKLGGLNPETDLPCGRGFP